MVFLFWPGLLGKTILKLLPEDGLELWTDVVSGDGETVVVVVTVVGFGVEKRGLNPGGKNFDKSSSCASWNRFCRLLVLFCFPKIK